MQIPLLRGRFLRQTDDLHSELAILVGSEMVRTYFLGRVLGRPARNGLADVRVCIALSLARRSARGLPAGAACNKTGSADRTPPRVS